MAIDATSSATTAGQAGSSARASIASNFDAFLTLLTTQLKNQSPLDPLDTNQFTQQLVQFAQVEQQLKQNDTLTSLLEMSKAATTSNAMSFVGMRVTADGATARLQNDQAEWQLDAPRGGSAIVQVRNASGSIVATERITLDAGARTYTWNGRTSTGATAPEGNYTLVIDAADSTGAAMTVATSVSGIVDSVDLTGSEPALKIGTLSIPLASIRSASRT